MLSQQSKEHVSFVYTCKTYLCNALVHVIYSGVSGQCSHTTQRLEWLDDNVLIQHNG